MWSTNIEEVIRGSLNIFQIMTALQGRGNCSGEFCLDDSRCLSMKSSSPMKMRTFLPRLVQAYPQTSQTFAYMLETYRQENSHQGEEELSSNTQGIDPNPTDSIFSSLHHARPSPRPPYYPSFMSCLLLLM